MVTLFLLFVLIVISISIEPKEDYFTIELYTNKQSLEVGEYLEISVRVKNKSIGLYKSIFAGQKIHIVISEEIAKTYINPLALPIYIWPFQLMTKESKIQLQKPGNYFVIAFLSFSIKEKYFYISENIEINVK